jgi:hypothetical protein
LSSPESALESESSWRFVDTDPGPLFPDDDVWPDGPEVTEIAPDWVAVPLRDGDVVVFAVVAIVGVVTLETRIPGFCQTD